MGFWSIVGGIAKAVGNEVVEKSNAMNSNKENFVSLTDEELFRKIKSSNSEIKVPALSVFKERGYTAEDLRGK